MKRLFETIAIGLLLAVLYLNAREYYNPTYPELNVVFETSYRKDLDDAIIEVLGRINDYNRERFLALRPTIVVVENCDENELCSDVVTKYGEVIAVRFQIKAYDSVNGFKNALSVEIGDLFGNYYF